MNRETWVVAGLVAVIAVLSTLLVVDLAGSREAYAQTNAQAGYVAVVAGPIVRNRTLPLIVVDIQSRTLMTYDYEITGDNKLILTTARSFTFDRRLTDYHYLGKGKSKKPSRTGRKDGDSVNEISDIVNRN